LKNYRFFFAITFSYDGGLVACAGLIIFMVDCELLSVKVTLLIFVF